MTDQQTIDHIHRLEDERGRALVAADWVTLDHLLSENLVHIHANGAIEDRNAYFTGLRKKLEFLRFERETLEIRGQGDVAVATGILRQTLRDRESNNIFDVRLVTTRSGCAMKVAGAKCHFTQRIFLPNSRRSLRPPTRHT